MTRLLCWLHSLACKRKALLATGCALGDCQLPGLYRRSWPVQGDDGTTRYLFCRTSHRTAFITGHQH